MSNFDDMLNFDPLDTAMKMTNKDYSTDEETMDLGMALHVLHAKNKKEELALRNDTYWSMPYAEALPILDDLGFQVVFTEKIGDDDVDEYTLLWREDGILMETDSYTSYEGATKVLNNIRFYYNWRPNNIREAYSVTSTGCFTSGQRDSEEVVPEEELIWTGHNDAKDALRHKIARLEANGTFLPVWVEAPLLTFSHRGNDDDTYKNWESTKEAWNVRFKYVVSHFPKELCDMLTAANYRI